MSVAEILVQVETLSPQERDELVMKLLAMRDDTPKPTQWKTGAEIVAMLNAMEPIELLIYPEIEDAVEWVKQIRKDQQKNRDLDWGADE